MLLFLRSYLPSHVSFNNIRNIRTFLIYALQQRNIRDPVTRYVTSVLATQYHVARWKKQKIAKLTATTKNYNY